MERNKIRAAINTTLLIFFGSLIMALAYALFIVPFHLVPGGVSGLAIIINYFTPLPVGLLIIALNIPIFIAGIRVMGAGYGLKTLLGMLVSSLLIDLLIVVLKIKAATENPLLAAIYGGILLGMGLGLIFRANASTGGSDVIGQIISKHTGITIGMAIMLVDFFVISLSGLAFQKLEAPLYGYVVLFLSSRVIDMVLEGWNHSKLVIITASKNDEIEEFILKELNRSGTALKSRSLYLNREGEIIISVIHRKQINELRRFIKSVDPEAFVVINDTHDVLGSGFRPIVKS